MLKYVRKKINKYVSIGKEEGAEVKVGGNIIMKETGGCYFEPTIFKNVKNNMKIAQEEIFGPVLTTLTFSDFEEARPRIKPSTADAFEDTLKMA